MRLDRLKEFIGHKNPFFNLKFSSDSDKNSEQCHQATFPSSLPLYLIYSTQKEAYRLGLL